MFTTSLRAFHFSADSCLLIRPAHSGVTPHAVSEVRILHSGAYHIAGCALDAAKGSTLAEKVQNMSLKTNVEDFLKLCKAKTDKYWALTVTEPGSVVIIPAGHLIVVTGAPEVMEGSGQML